MPLQDDDIKTLSKVDRSSLDDPTDGGSGDSGADGDMTDADPRAE